MKPPLVKFPARPLLAVWERIAIEKGYLGPRPALSGKAENHLGIASFCDVIGVGEQAYLRAKRDGWVTLGMADRVTCALGLHPILIWPGEYEAWLGCEPPPDVAEEEYRRDFQRSRQRERGAA